MLRSHCLSGTREGRDIEGELWAASGWSPRFRTFSPPQWAHDLANKQGLPIYLVRFDEDVYAVGPKPPQKDRLPELLSAEPESERVLANQLVVAYCDSNVDIATDPRLKRLSPKARFTICEYYSAPEPHGPPHVFVREAFPTIRYLRRLLRHGALKAKGSAPGELEASELSRLDWADHEIVCRGNSRRLGVWRIGAVGTDAEAFQNVRIERESILQAFPAAETSLIEDEMDALLRNEITKNGGFLSQNDGAEILRECFPQLSRDQRRERVKALTNNTKQGPHGPRKHCAK